MIVRLVQQQQLRWPQRIQLGGQGNFQALSPTQLAGFEHCSIRIDPHLRQPRPCLGFGQLRVTFVKPLHRRALRILQPGMLIQPADMTTAHHVPRTRWKLPGDDLQQGRLAAPVGAQNSHAHRARQRQVDWLRMAERQNDIDQLHDQLATGHRTLR
ncbi:hypothetical protein D3C84_651170 [compost metagenome]